MEDINSNISICTSRGVLKKRGLYVGDEVYFESIKDKNVIEKLVERKNFLPRPSVSNIDKLLIIVAPIPKPDFFVIDKLILFSFSFGIEPVIVVNKIDMDSDKLTEYIQSVYQNVCQIFCVSAHTGYNIDELKAYMHESISVLAGQSAVGKSSLINEFFQDDKAQIGDLSNRIERGKNTTRCNEMYRIDTNTFIVDTPGFSLLDENLLSIKHSALASFYPDFVRLAELCKFSNSCLHYHENKNDCAVKKAVEMGDIDKGRYERYLQIYDVLEKRWKYEHK